MTAFDLSTVTLQAATAYDPEFPFKNLEGMANAALQMLALMKANGVKVTGSGDLAETIQSFSSSVLAIADIKLV